MQLSVENISKVYRNPDGDLAALSEVSFVVSNGEFVAIFGPNGSGKTTLLNIILGVETATSGQVRFEGGSRASTGIGFVFQNYNESLFPWLSVLENVVFPLDLKKMSREQSLAKAESVLKKVRLWEHRDKYLYQLSGGMRQLVAIARAFIVEPDVLLLDEPCSALDYSVTKRIELEILSLWSERRATTLLISHDIDEAVFLADRIIILSARPGRIKEIIPVDLPRPRDLSILTSERFFEIRSQVLNAFLYE